MSKSRKKTPQDIERNREWNRSNRERINAQRREAYARKKLDCPDVLISERRVEKLKQRYGLTPEQYETLFSTQDGKCAICFTTDPGSKTGWHLDHNHETGDVRGVLCHHCNVMLGYAKDNVTTLSRAVEYLKEPPWKTA